MKEQPAANIYARNLARFKEFYPLEAHRLEQGDYESGGPVEFCRSYEGELNLVDHSREAPFYWHSQQGVYREAEAWMAIQSLDACDVFFVYGMGLGYYYIPLKTWLAANKKRYLVFIEDDGRVINKFLHTRLATDILNDPQVIIGFYPLLRERGHVDWQELQLRIRSSASFLFEAFALRTARVSALQSYFISYFDFFDKFAIQLQLNLATERQKLAEFLGNSIGVYENFYANIYYLSSAVPFSELAGCFNSFPAIICGAGPSLEKQFHSLSQLVDRALILPAGSAMNAITRASICPHAGAGVDPTPTQESRQLTSFAYDIPLIYEDRYYFQAIAQWHGPLLHVANNSAVHILRWFEKELGFQFHNHILGGVSTANFLLEMALFLGCNPIIMVGMDLAYTQDKRYVEGVAVHPADSQEEKKALHEKSEYLLPFPGLDGTTVYTKNVWFLESIFITQLKQLNPSVTFINATEGGLPIEMVPNVPLEEVKKRFLNAQWDVCGWLHGEIQLASKKAVVESVLIHAIAAWKAILQQCAVVLESLETELKKNLAKVKEGVSLVSEPYSGKAALWLAELHQHDGYTYFLHSLDQVFTAVHLLLGRLIQYFVRGKRKRVKEISLEIRRCQFLKRYVGWHLDFMDAGQTMYLKRQKALQTVVPNAIRLQNAEQEVEFQPESHRLEERGERVLLSYPDGSVKAEAFYREGLLHGPWTFYSPQGTILARSQFVNGVRQGICACYYLDGSLYSIQRYKDGKQQGHQRYYYPDGILKSDEEYQDGKLNLVVRLYYSNGQQKLEQHFVEGKLHGCEKIWAVDGRLAFEAEYAYNQPIGSARHWHPNGQLATEVIFSGTGPDEYISRRWDEKGRPLRKKRDSGNDDKRKAFSKKFGIVV